MCRRSAEQSYRMVRTCDWLLVTQADKKEYRGILAALEGITGKKLAGWVHPQY